MKTATLILFFALLINVFGCDLYEQNNYQEYYVIESYLVAHNLMPRVRLSTTSRITEKYNFEDQAVSDADVKIHLLNTDGSIAETYQYLEARAGIYGTSAPALVQDQHWYRLHVTTASGDEITSTTYVPEGFNTVNQLQPRYLYQGSQQIEITATPSSYITGRPTYYLFNVNVVHPTPDNLTPFYKDLIADQNNDIASYYQNSSGIITERNYHYNADGNIELKVPWLTVAFFDSNDVVVSAIDDNLYHFLRSQDVQSGGFSLSPGEIQNIRYNVNGGIGIFGSISTDTNRVFIVRP